MVRFGRYISANQIAGWENYYLGYKALKKKINQFAAQLPTASEQERQKMKKSFSDLLDYHVERIVLFVLERQGLLAEELQRLREARDTLEEGSGDGEDQVTEQLMNQYRKVGVELLRLLEFVELNTTGLRKILKKFERRVKCVFRDQYISSRANHPYSQLQQIFRQVGLKAMVATISQNLVELRAKGTSSSSFFRQPSLPATVIEEEPIIKAIEVALQKITTEVSFISFVANELLLPSTDDLLPGTSSEEAHYWSMQLNLFNTFLYMVNYYIVVPTSDDYAAELDAPPTLCGIIIGSMPFTALLSAFVYSWWSNFSYRTPLVISTLILLAGNLLYALALRYSSVWLLLLGRALCGLGGARALNRRYIADHVPLRHRTQASATFVSVSALGMAIGPALAGVLNFVDFEIWGAPVNSITAPGWLMAVLWTFYLFFLVLLFTEPPVAAHPEPALLERSVSESPPLEKTEGSASLKAPLLSRTLSLPPLSKSSDSDESPDDDDVKRAATKFSVETPGDLLQELTIPVKLLLGLYFALKFASEMLVSESSVTTEFYFDWGSYQVGIFLGLLGLTVLPMSAVVGNCISNIFEDRLVILWAEGITCFGVIGILSYSIWVPYTPVQYICAAIVIFVSTNVLEGVTMSLLSKVMSARLSRGIFNCGFLSTEAGTLARVIANAMITLAGWLGPVEALTNISMIPTLAIMFIATCYTYLYYFALY